MELRLPVHSIVKLSVFMLILSKLTDNNMIL